MDEVTMLSQLINGRKLAKTIYACTGRHVIRQIEANGQRSILEKLGVTFVADTCVVVTPILPAGDGVLMTNSGKFAHYAPGNTGYAVQYGSLKDCVESAVTGRLTRDNALWR
jgi:predicted aconitase